MDSHRAVIVATVVGLAVVIAVPAFIGGFRETWIDAAAGIALGAGAVLVHRGAR